jgi:hypothetical protein
MARFEFNVNTPSTSIVPLQVTGKVMLFVLPAPLSPVSEPVMIHVPVPDTLLMAFTVAVVQVRVKGAATERPLHY